MSSVNKVVLAYSGGLDTSVICEMASRRSINVKWSRLLPILVRVKRWSQLEQKLRLLGVLKKSISTIYGRSTPATMYSRCFAPTPSMRASTCLGTSIARPLIAKRLIEIANETGADAISHGATGKGNDQVRFELGAYALKPGITVIAPWREWDLNSRDKLMEYCEVHNIPVEMKRGKKSPFSMDANLLHISYEGGNLEDPWSEAEDDMWRWTVSPEQAPDKPTYMTITYEKGDIAAIDGTLMSPATVMEELNKLGGAHGIGRLDIVENRFVGMKSRGCYETPAGTIMLRAHRAIESLTLDREAAHLKDELMPTLRQAYL